MDIINGFRQIFSRRPSQNDVERLARFMKSKQGIKLTAQLMQQTDSLTKKGCRRLAVGLAAGDKL